MPEDGRYCQPSDINVGAVTLSADTKTTWIQNVSEEMDAKLGLLYQVPIQVSVLPYFERMLLKMICVKIATGRILNMISGAQDPNQNANGLRMIQEGLDELHMLAGGEIALSAERAGHVDVDPDDGGIGAQGARQPTIVNADSESLVEGFYRQMSGGRLWSVRPYDQAPGV